MKDRTINIRIEDCTGSQKKFTSFKVFIEFCKNEADFWKSEKVKNDTKHKRSHNCFSAEKIFRSIVEIKDSWKDTIDKWTDDELSANLNNFLTQYRHSLANYWIWSSHGYTRQFLDVLENHGENAVNAFFSLVVKNSVTQISNGDILTGLISGYEYITQDSEILSRRNSEKQSIDQLRDRLSKAQENLFDEVSKSQQAFAEWDTKNREEANRVIQNHKEAGEQQISSQDNKFEENLRKWANTITTLEVTYEEKLRLDKPAQYWNKAAVRYSRQGLGWITAIVSLVVIALINFQKFFVHWLSGKDIELELASFQGVILFGTILATYAFALRIFSRLAFSSFHLMRDAQEREQLTYLYLSLTNEAAIDKESRDIVLQALFSRSETGLLAQEHGPTMPGIDALKSTMGK